MKDGEPTHRLDVRVAYWTKDELNEPGLVAPKECRTNFYRGTIDDCDLAAKAAGAPTLKWDSPASTDFPFDDRTYHQYDENGGLLEIWCRGRSLRGDLSPWVQSLPLASDVFPAEREEAATHE
jgi:hypothetical protein